MAHKKEKINDPVLDLSKRLNDLLTKQYKDYYQMHCEKGGSQDEQSSKRDI